MPVKPKLNTDEILKAEYTYIANTVFQANEDRSRVASFYFVTVGSLVATILSALNSTNNKSASLAFAALFLVLTVLGTLTLAQLARLRAAWHESAQAMNKIKDFYIKHNKEIEPAFKWRTQTLPSTDKPFSIANLMAVEVVLLSAVTTTTSIYFFLQFFGNIKPWGWLTLAAIFTAGSIILWKWYKHLLVDNQ